MRRPGAAASRRRGRCSAVGWAKAARATQFDTVPTRRAHADAASFSDAAFQIIGGATPVGRQYSLRSVTMKRTVRPVADLRYVATLHRVEVDVIDMTFKISVVADRMFPIPAAFTSRQLAR